MKKILITLFSLSLIFSLNTVLAADNSTGSSGPDNSTGVNTSNQTAPKLENPLKVGSIKDVIILIVDIIIYVGVSFSILAIIFVGFKFVMAQGNPDKISEAKNWFLYIIIGLAILISSKVIVEIVKNTLVKSGVVNQDFLR